MQSWGWLRAASFGLRASYSHIAKLYHYGSCEFLFARSAQPVARRQLLSPEVFRIPLGIFLPLFRQVVQREDGRDWTHGNASATVDAFHGINVEHLFRPELVGVFLGMNAIHRTGVDTGGVFGSNAGFGNYVGHKILLLLRVLPGRVTEHMILARTRLSVQIGAFSSRFRWLKSAIGLSRCRESKSSPQGTQRNTKDGLRFFVLHAFSNSGSKFWVNAELAIPQPLVRRHCRFRAAAREPPESSPVHRARRLV